MTIHLRLPALAAFALIGLVAPATAAPAVPADANEALWCATAFTQVEPQARSAGQTEMADNFLKYGKGLTTTGHDLLIKAGFTEDEAKAQAATFVDTVTKQLGAGGKPDFTVEACTALADPAAAAAMTAKPPADATAPATTPAPAAK